MHFPGFNSRLRGPKENGRDGKLDDIMVSSLKMEDRAAGGRALWCQKEGKRVSRLRRET